MPGLAWPLVAFITWPTNQPSTFSLPSRNWETCLSLLAIRSSMIASSKPAAAIVEEKGLKQISDTGALEAIIDDLIANNDKQVSQFREGNEKVLGWFVGQVMKATKGQANPGMVNQLLRKKLGG